MRPRIKHKTPKRSMPPKLNNEDEEDDELYEDFLIVEDHEEKENTRAKKIILGILILVLLSFVAFPTYLILSNQEIKVINYNIEPKETISGDFVTANINIKNTINISPVKPGFSLYLKYNRLIDFK